MVGAVNYGSGKKAYDPLQTVAGKTGTCIGSGGWIGLFTSYAPLANPRLSVVVITKGPDAHRHFPAAVAGQIYRELNHRFGTVVNLPVATTGTGDDSKAADLNEEEKDAAAAEAEEMEKIEKAAEEAEQSAQGQTESTSANPEKTTATAPATTPATIPANTAPPRTVKPVLMQIPTNQKPAETKPAPAPKTTSTLPPAAQTRPRRTQQP
jgi:hypothetical protein